MREDTPMRRPTVEEWERALFTFYALRLFADEPEGRQAWEILDDLHEEREFPTAHHRGELVGEAFLKREVSLALILLESMVLYDGEIPATLTFDRATQSRCLTPGCPNLAVWRYCTDCELQRLTEDGGT